MIERTASCACGGLRAICRGEPVRVSICHCLECQRRTGSAFGTQARFALEDVQVEGKASHWERTGDTGKKVRFRFCGTCGTTLLIEPEGLPGFVAVAVGAFADPSFPAPKVSIYEARRHAWTSMPDLACEHFD
jgi:hypothetical protein